MTKIDEYAFSYCNNLESVSIPGSVKILPESLFEADMKLKKVTLGQGVSRIERAAFRHCGLTGVSFLDSVTVIGEGAFSFVQISERCRCRRSLQRSGTVHLIIVENWGILQYLPV